MFWYLATFLSFNNGFKNCVVADDSDLTILNSDWSDGYLSDDLTIYSFDSTKKIAFVKLIKQFFGLSLKESKDFSESLPQSINLPDKSDDEISDFFDELEGLGAVYQTGKGVRSIKKIIFHSEPTEQTDGQVVGTNGLCAFVDDENTLNIYTKNGEQIYAPKNSSDLFACCTDLETIDFANFNTGLVDDMSGMFRHCILLQSLDLSTFDTSNVLDMSNMFCECFSLTDLKLNGFDTSNVLNMSGMFSGLKSIEEYDLSDFDTSNVADMSYMFDCNQSISSFGIENFNTSSVKNFEGIFKDCSELKNLSILNWNFESGENFDDFLLNCNSIQSIKIDASTLDENVIYLPQSFYCGEKLLSYISNENIEYGDDYVQVESLPQNWLQIVSSKLSKSLNSLKSINFVCSDDEITDDNEIVENVGFSYDAQERKLDVFSSTFIISPESMVKFIPATFTKLEELNLSNLRLNATVDTLSNFVEGENSWSSNITYLTVDFGDLFDTSNVVDLSKMFENCVRLKSVYFGEKFNIENVENTSKMFYNCRNLQSLDLSNFNTTNVQDMSYMFYNCREMTAVNVSSFNTENVTNMSYMFCSCNKLSAIDVSGFDTSNVLDMSGMFCCCESVESLNVSGFNTSNVTSVNQMFDCMSSLLELDVSGFDTSNVENFSYMFSNLTAITQVNISNFNTSSALDMSGMFCWCENLTSIDVSNFDTSNVEDMTSMFCGLTSITSLDINHFDLSNCVSLCELFCCCENLEQIDISGLDTLNVEDFDYMFSDCYNLKTIIGIEDLDVSNAINMEGMFCDTFALEELDLSRWNVQNVEYIGYFLDMSYINDLEDYDTVNLKYLSLENWQLNSVGEEVWCYDNFLGGCDALETIILPFYQGKCQIALPDEFYVVDFLDLSNQDSTTDMLLNCEPGVKVLQKVGTDFDLNLPEPVVVENKKTYSHIYVFCGEMIVVAFVLFFNFKLQRKKNYEKSI